MVHPNELNGKQGTGLKIQRGVDGGFTLADLLMILGTFSLLLILLIQVMGQTRRIALQNECIENLKELGQAINSYARDHDGMLPGPAYTAASAHYDCGSTNELVWFLSKDLGLPAPGTNVVVAPMFVCPGQIRAVPQVASNLGRISYLLTDNLATTAGAHARPFGLPAASPLPPLNLSSLGTWGPPERLPAIMDIDRGNVDPKVPFWGDLSYEPVHGRTRNQLFFDGHVEAMKW